MFFSKTVKRWFVIAVVVFVAVFSAIQFDKKIVPAAMEISCIQVKSIANNSISDAIMEVIDYTNAKSNDFIEISEGNIYTDSILINKFCAEVSNKLSYKLKETSNQNVSVPLGAVTGMVMFANIGPDITFNVMPMGDADVDYETSFYSAGINQVNFKIWIKVTITMRIVNPLIEEKIIMTRKMMLVDTVIKGDVPEGMILNSK